MKTCAGFILKRVLLGIALVTAFGAVVMLLWNGLVPALFKGPALSFSQAVGLLVLAHILFRGPGGCGGWRRHRWRQRFEEKLAAMTPEEREKFKREWNCCGWWGEEEEAKKTK